MDGRNGNKETFKAASSSCQSELKAVDIPVKNNLKTHEARLPTDQSSVTSRQSTPNLNWVNSLLSVESNKESVSQLAPSSEKADGQEPSLTHEHIAYEGGSKKHCQLKEKKGSLTTDGNSKASSLQGSKTDSTEEAAKESVEPVKESRRLTGFSGHAASSSESPCTAMCPPASTGSRIASEGFPRNRTSSGEKLLHPNCHRSGPVEMVGHCGDALGLVTVASSVDSGFEDGGMPVRRSDGGDRGDLHEFLRQKGPGLSPSNQMLILARHQTLRDLTPFHRTVMDVMRSVQDIFPDCSVYCFGSVVNGLATRDSDLDIHVDLENQYTAERTVINRNRKLELLESSLLQAPGIFSQVVPIPHARVPVVKTIHIPTGVHCDLSFKNMMGIYNSQFIRCCVDYDSRFQPLFLTIKQFLKTQGLVGCGGGVERKITSYALTLMLIFYLQQLEQPILPPIAETLLFDDDEINREISVIDSHAFILPQPPSQSCPRCAATCNRSGQSCEVMARLGVPNSCSCQNCPSCHDQNGISTGGQSNSSCCAEQQLSQPTSCLGSLGSSFQANSNLNIGCGTHYERSSSSSVATCSASTAAAAAQALEQPWRIADLRRHRRHINGWNFAFSFGSPYAKQRQERENTSNLDQLLVGFFEFYSTFYYEFIICPYFGTEVTRDSFHYKDLVGLDKWLETAFPRAAKHFKWCFDHTSVYKRGLQVLGSPLCIQDPFELNHNVSRNVDPATLTRLRKFCSEAVAFCGGLQRPQAVSPSLLTPHVTSNLGELTHLSKAKGAGTNHGCDDRLAGDKSRQSSPTLQTCWLLHFLQLKPSDQPADDFVDLRNPLPAKSPAWPRLTSTQKIGEDKIKLTTASNQLLCYFCGLDGSRYNSFNELRSHLLDLHSKESRKFTYRPVQVIETVSCGGRERHNLAFLQCITCSPDLVSTSQEELRWEHYQQRQLTQEISSGSKTSSWTSFSSSSST